MPRAHNESVEPASEERSTPESYSVGGLAKLHVGQVIGERYRIEGPLGQGGMGVVYSAVHQHTGRAVALKLIQCAWDDERLELYQRFLSEARAASAIRHPNVVEVLDFGFLSGAPYLVMEHLRGESLEDLFTRLQVVPLESTLRWLLPVMGALAALHEKGVVHRDVKPSNIFLSQDEGTRVVPKLLDFGLARVTRDAPLTHPGVMLGTPEYMAPERARGQAVGPAADVWAMGVVAFECLCGRLPFTATSLNGIAAQIVAGEVQSARTVNPSLPSALAAVIDRALQNAPEQRHQDMAQFAYALGEAALGAGLSVPADPDPIGLPNFAALHLQGDPWASGPLAKVFAAASEAQRNTPVSSIPAAPTAPRSEHVHSQRWWLGLVALLFLGLVVIFTGTRRRARPLDAPPASVPVSSRARPPLPPAPPTLVSAPATSEVRSEAPFSPPARSESDAGSVRAPSRRAVRAEHEKRALRRAATKPSDLPLADANEFEKEWN